MTMLTDFFKFMTHSIKYWVSALQYREGWLAVVILVLIKMMADATFSVSFVGNMIVLGILFAFSAYHYKEEYTETIRLRQVRKEREMATTQMESDRIQREVQIRKDKAERLKVKNEKRQERRGQATLTLSKKMDSLKEFDISPYAEEVSHRFKHVTPDYKEMTNDVAYEMLRREKNRFVRLGSSRLLPSGGTGAEPKETADVARKIQDVLSMAKKTPLRWENKSATNKDDFLQYLADRGIPLPAEGTIFDDVAFAAMLSRANEIPNVLDSLQSAELILRRGHDGEQIVMNELDKYSNSLKVLYGNRFDARRDGTVENDALLFTDAGVFSIEVKNIKSGGNQSIHIAKDGRWSEKNHAQGEWKPDERSSKIIDQVNRHVYLTEQFLQSHADELTHVYTKDQLTVHPIIVIANNNVTIENETDWKIVRPNQVFSLVRGAQVLSEVEQEELKALFERHDLGQKKFKHLNFGEVGEKMEQDLEKLVRDMMIRKKFNELYDIYTEANG